MEEPAVRRKGFIRSRAFKVILIVLGILVVLWVATEIAGPRIAGSVARKQVTDRYPDAREVSVSIRAFPALKLAFRKYDNLRVQVEGVTLQGVEFDRIELESDSWPEGTFTATISEAEIERFFTLENSYVENPDLKVKDSDFVVSGSVNVGPRSVEVSATGTLEAVDGVNIYFRPAEIEVADVAVPEEAAAKVRQLMEQDPVFVVRRDLPYRIDGIAVEGGMLVITGSADLEEALNVRL